MRGTVRTWNRGRAYGWVEAEDGRVYFAHREQVVYFEHLEPGQPVEFTPLEAPRGPRAMSVQRLARPERERARRARSRS